MVATGQTTKFASVVSTEIIDVLNPTKSCVLDDKIIQHYNLAKCSIQSYADIVGITWITAASLASTLTLLTRKQL